MLVVGTERAPTNLDPRIGLDISGANNANSFATILTGGTDKLYSINLSTGAATLVGTIGTGTTVYSGLTNATAIPEPATLALAVIAAAASSRPSRRTRGHRSGAARRS